MKWVVELFGTWLTVVDAQSGKFLIQVEITVFTSEQISEMLVAMFDLEGKCRRVRS